jgi:tRNA threonylcarbamoyl adenosine modification protein YeaZ
MTNGPMTGPTHGQPGGPANGQTARPANGQTALPTSGPRRPEALLAMDTATSAISVALVRPGAEPVSRSLIDPRGHTEHLAPLIASVLREAGVAPEELTDLAVGTGPGPFTGLRVGLVTARTMGFALGIPVHGVCSLDVLARMAALRFDGELLVATDARRKEVYWARYAAAGGQVRRLSEPAVERPAHLPEELRALPTAGRGPLLFPGLFPSSTGDVVDVDAAVLAALALEQLASGLELPVEALYLRRPDAQPVSERKSTIVQPAAMRGRGRPR